MTRPLRIARSICPRTGKHRYASYFEARAAAASIISSTQEDHGRPYRCDECDGWHLGRARQDQPDQ